MKENKTQQIRKYMIDHPPQVGENGYYKSVAQIFGSTADYVRNIAQRIGLRNVRFTTYSKRSWTNLTDALDTLLTKSKKEWLLEELSNHFDVGIAKIESSLEILRRRGKNIHIRTGMVELSRTLPQADATPLKITPTENKIIRFGFTADNHLCSLYERLDVLEALYDIWEKKGIKTVYQAGNIIDGEASFNKFDIKVRGIDGQINYLIENWPKRKGMELRFITGDDHEGWYIQREGIDIGRRIEQSARDAGRKDMTYLGHMEHDIEMIGKKGSTVMRLIHAGGGSAYATSYTAQKIVESYQGGEKPKILLIGHYHKAEYGYPREVHCIQGGCTEDQTPFMRKKKIQAHVGGWSVEFRLDDWGIPFDFNVTWHPFFDKGYYDKAWKYKFQK